MWAMIDEFPEYDISDDGRVRRDDHLLNPFPTGSGHLAVTLYDRGRQKTIKVHVLVAKAFVPGWAKGLTAHHINENKTDNRASNLEWVTSSQHAEKHDFGANSNNAGANNGRAKFTIEEIRVIRAEYVVTKNIRKLARKYAVDPRTMREIVLGWTYKEI